MVYVDEPRWLWKGRMWCHLTADHLDELHQFAAKLGLKRVWFQDKRYQHYDTVFFDKAVKLGAKVVDSRVLVLKSKALFGEIFVFGSNLAGRHGKGSALHAKRYYGAIQGIGEGQMGRSYAIPTKDGGLRVLSLYRIRVGVIRFKRYAAQHPELHFRIVKVGCGLAGYVEHQIAPMFRNCPPNCELPGDWGDAFS
jgi:hypothetical protein